MRVLVLLAYAFLGAPLVAGFVYYNVVPVDFIADSVAAAGFVLLVFLLFRPAMGRK